jgi:hypothetical protein
MIQDLDGNAGRHQRSRPRTLGRSGADAPSAGESAVAAPARAPS